MSTIGEAASLWQVNEMRHHTRRHSAVWRASAVAASLVACSVYDAPESDPSNAASSGAVSGDAAGEQGSSSSGTGGGSLSNGGTSDSSGGASAGSDVGSAGKSPSAGRSGSGGSGGSSGTAVVPDTGGAGAGAMVNAGGDGGEGGAPPIVPTTFRYVKLVALTEQSGNVWSSVAELQVLTTGSKPLSSSGWTIKADSEETSTENAPAAYAIDGKSTTYWHTHWTWDAAADAPLPHNLIVDLGAAAVVTGFTYLPRQDNKTNGRIKDWAFYVSSNGTTWGSPVKTGSFPSGAALQTVTF